MKKTKILQMGLGPLGIKISKYIRDKESMDTVAAVDINPELYHKDLGALSGTDKSGILIENDISKVSNLSEVDIVVLTTTSHLQAISKQIETILDYNLPIVSSCEELTFPWENDMELSEKIDRKAKEKGVAVVSTGVNPGFLMDTLPSVLTGVSRKVDHILVNRFQDAKYRRIPFQRKIGAGLTVEEFDKKKNTGTLRHVGLTESMQFIAAAVGWKLDKTEDIISPIIAETDIYTESMQIKKGDAMGVRQIGRGYSQGEEKVKLVFEAAVGLGESFDEIKILGEPDIHSRIEGGINGDVATCSIVLNAIPNVLAVPPGLKTMKDLSIVSYAS